MGDPKRHRKKYSTPVHPWQKARIEDEKQLIEEYGLKNKREIWKMVSKLKSFSKQAKSLVARTSTQGEREKQQLMSRLQSLNLLPEDADLDDVLGLETKDIMERRLQTIVFRKGLAKSMNQARQFIVHGHILIGERKLTAPSYLVKKDEENEVALVPGTNIEAAIGIEEAKK
ncbi:30S ribosomal protein S4 [Candidatus Woesearchaeota archaeon]|nr:30S ribosomal protein S4 [Candidatus Woesearchaeota archaeon]